MAEETYETPSVVELGSFTEETGTIGVANREEVVWHFDTWN
ncbi:lasso RiPP family leader peptide-containing protein [Saccharothrix longispora]|nr:lasso RiPP family leader peptide-containing protein [Saccharothrix longispora]MBY8853994.1 lasso RiPP family leader peptide-containing protein [Saccharothrix sp. MB29]MDU0289726.1 lasso RiPP family leader peptide-containing protein [Saccharothrix longispora]